MKKITSKNKILFFSVFYTVLFLVLIFIFPLSTLASPEENIAEMEARKTIPIQSNEFINWPIGPIIGAEGAILIEPNSNTILYSKNCNKKLYPASTTKILTAILIIENCDLNETITFSKNAIDSVSWNDSNMNACIGDQITVQEALYAILVGSANEAAYAMAEHISGDVSSFSDLMNEKAKELGCLNSHFTNPSGLHCDNHYTTAYDLALIAKEFFKYDFLCKLSSTFSYEIPSSNFEKEPTLLYTKNKLLPNREYYYPSLVGSKTGYTGPARQTLVSCAQKNGMSLICVILKEEAPFQFEDTVSLFNYGFNNFSNIPIAENESNYKFSFSEPFQCEYSILGDTTALLSCDDKYYVTLPNSASFNNLSSEIILEIDPKTDSRNNYSNVLAHINYYYYSSLVGFLPIHIEEPSPQIVWPDNSIFIEKENALPKENKIYYFQLETVIFAIVLIVGSLLLATFLKNLFFNDLISKSRKGRKRRRKSNSPYKSFKF